MIKLFVKRISPRPSGRSTFDKLKVYAGTEHPTAQAPKAFELMTEIRHGYRYDEFYSTGRRKAAVARVWLMPGEEKITINRRDAEAYLCPPHQLARVEQPLVATDTRGEYDI